MLDHVLHACFQIKAPWGGYFVLVLGVYVRLHIPYIISTWYRNLTTCHRKKKYDPSLFTEKRLHYVFRADLSDSEFEKEERKDGV